MIVPQGVAGRHWDLHSRVCNSTSPTVYRQPYLAAPCAPSRRRALDPIAVMRGQVCSSRKLQLRLAASIGPGASRTDIPHLARGSSASTPAFRRTRQPATSRLYATRSTDCSQTGMLLLAPREGAQFPAPPILVGQTQQTNRNPLRCPSRSRQCGRLLRRPKCTALFA